MRQIAQSLFWLDLGIANAYLIRSKNAVVLVDAGIQRSLPRIEHSLKQVKLAWHHLTHILITHAHPDHAGNFPEIARLSGAPVWAHRLEAPILRGQKPVLRPDSKNIRWVDRWLERSISALIRETQATGAVERELQEEEPLSNIVPDLRVVHLPGHSAGHIGFYHKLEGWLIGGDVLMNLAGLSFPMAAFTPDPAEAWRGILRVATIQPQILALGHGRPLRHTEPALRPMARRAHRELQRMQADPDA